MAELNKLSSSEEQPTENKQKQEEIVTDTIQIARLNKLRGNKQSEISKYKNLENSYSISQNKKAEEGIQNLNLSKNTDIPVSAFSMDADNKKEVLEIDKRNNSAKIDWYRFNKDNPRLSKIISNPANMDAMHDDLLNLAEHETILTGLKSLIAQSKEFTEITPKAEAIKETAKITREGYKKGQLNIKLAEEIDRDKESYLKTGKFSNEAELQRLEQELAKYPEREGFNLFAGASEQLPNLIGGIVESSKQALKYGLAAGGAASVVGAGIVSPITAASGFGVGATYGALKGTYDYTEKLEGSFALREYSKMPGVSKEEAVRMADIVGSINGLIETGSDIVLAKVGSTLLKGALGKTVAKTPKFVFNVIKKAKFGEKVATTIENNIGKYGNLTLRKAIMQAVLDFAKIPATEVLEEFTQEIATATGEQLLKKETEFDMGEVLERASKTIKPTLESTALLGFLGSGVSLYTNIGKLADQSKTRKRDTNIYQKNVAEFTKDTENENVYISKDKFDKILEDNNLKIDSVVKFLDIEELYQDSNNMQNELGETKVKIPFDGWIAKAKKIQDDTGVDLYNLMKDDVSFSEAELTINQTKDIEKRQESIAKEIEISIAKAKAEIEKETVVKEAETYFKTQLNAMEKPKYLTAKQWETQKKVYAKISAAHIPATAELRGLTPQQYFEQYEKPKIVSEIDYIEKQGEVISNKKEFVKEIKSNIGETTLIYVPENVRSDWEEVVKNNPGLFTYKKSTSAISTDELVDVMRITETEIMDRLKSDFKFELRQTGNITKTPEFKKWFGDSKVVNKKNEPLVVYHGTNEKFEEFKLEGKSGFEKAAYFSNKRKVAKGYSRKSGIVLESYLSIKNPYIVDVRGATFNDYYTQMLADIGSAKKHGYDGVILKNIKDDFEQKGKGILGDTYVVFSPTQIKSTRNIGDFNITDTNIYKQTGDKVIKGATVFTKNKPIIKIFKNADYSTYLHEISHTWLKEGFDYINSGQATEVYKEYWKNISDFLDIKEDQTKLTREQQEKFARSFEAYLMEGKSPSENLSSVFRKIKQWMIRIYQTLQGLVGEAGFNIEINDQVRAIMDRLIATEDEINFAIQNMNYDKTISPKLLSSEVAIKLDNLRLQAYNEAFLIMQKQVMADLTTERKNEIRAIKNSQRERILNELKEEPIFEAMALIRETFDKDAKEISNKYIETLKKENKTMDDINFINRFDLFAEELGVAGYVLANEVINSDTLEEAIEKELDNYVVQNYPDLMDTKNIRQEAYLSLHNEKSSEVLALEKIILNDLIIKNETTSKYSQTEIDYEKRIAKNKAKQILSKKPIDEAEIYLPYYAAEREEAIKYYISLEKKDYENAFIHKSRQILNLKLGAEAWRIKQETLRSELYLKNVQQKDAKLFKSQEYLDQASKLLARFGFVRDDYNPNTEKVPLVVFDNAISEKLGIENIASWLYAEDISKNYKKLNINQLNDVVGAVKRILRVANIEDKFLKIESKQNLLKTVNIAIPKLKENIKESKRKKNNKKMKEKKDSKKILEPFVASLKKYSMIVSQMDGWKDFGFFYNLFYKPIIDSATTEVSLKDKYNTRYADIIKKHYPDKEFRNLDNKIYYESLGTATKKELLMIGLNIGNIGNRNKLFRTMPLNFEVKEWTEAFVLDFLSKNLTKNDWNFIQEIWNMLDDLFEPSKALYKRLTNFDVKGIEKFPFKIQTKDGGIAYLDGGYFPLDIDKRINFESISKLERKEEELRMTPLGEKKLISKNLPSNDYIKKRSDVKYPLALDMSIIGTHMAEVIHDVSFREAIIDLTRLFNNKELSTSLRLNIGEDDFLEMKKYVGDVGYGDVQIRNALDILVNSLKKSVSVALLSLNVRIITQNLANIFNYEGAIDGFNRKEAFMGALSSVEYIKDLIFNRQKYLEVKGFVYDNSRIMKSRKTNFDYTLKQEFKDDENIRKFLFGLIGFTDELTAVPMWIVAYNKIIEETGNNKKAVEYADLLIERVIGTGSKIDTASFLRNKSGIYNLFNMFYSFFNTEYNRWVREFGILSNTKDINRFLGFVVRKTAFIVASEVLSFRLAKKDRKGDRDWFKWFLKQNINYILGTIGMLRDMSSVVNSILFDTYNFGYQGSSLFLVPIEIGKAVSNIVKIGKDYYKGKKIDIQKPLENIARSTALTKGYPDIINKIAFNVFDNIFNDMPFTLDEFIRRIPERERKIRKRR